MLDLSAVVLVVGFCAAMVLLSVPSSWLRRLAERVAGLLSNAAGQPGTAFDGRGEADTREWEVLTRPYVRGRLDALAAELERLDRDPDVFAKAFHTMAARAALESLLADAHRLMDRPTPSAAARFEVEVAGTSTGPLEELEL